MKQVVAGGADAIEAGSMQRMLDALPKTTPLKVLRTIEGIFNMGGTQLPPQVFFAIVEQSSVAISITDTQARILYVNPAFKTVTGYDPAELTGQNQSVLSYKTTPKAVYEALWRHLVANQPWTGLLVNRRKDGTRYLAEITISPVLDSRGETIYFLGMHRDVTAMHQLERQVQNQKALIESVVEGAPIALAVLDEREKVVVDNHEYKKLIGDLGLQEPAARVLESLRTIMGDEFEAIRQKGGSFVEREVQFERCAGGARWFSCSGTWFVEEDASADSFFESKRRPYMLLVMNDISALKRKQEEQRFNALRAVLAEGERVRSLRETLAGAIYQLQGPVNLIAAAANMVERRGPAHDPQALAGVLREALQAGQHALETLRGSMPKELDEAVAPVNLNELLRDVLVILTERFLVAGITVDWKPAPVLAAIPGRPTELRNMFKQIIDNAIDAVVGARSQLREVRISTVAAEDAVSVFVEDSGPGIPEELRLKVFEPFFTTKPGGRSAGMGLTMVQDVVTSHGGMIEIDAHPAAGSRIHVRLPLAGAAEGTL